MDDKSINSSINSLSRTVSKPLVRQENRRTETPDSTKTEVEKQSSVNTTQPIKQELSVEEVRAKELADRKEEKLEESNQGLSEKIQQAIPKVRELLQQNQRSLDFKVAEEENRVIITVIDKETDRVIRQIPPEDVLQIASAIEEGIQEIPEGSILNFKA